MYICIYIRDRWEILRTQKASNGWYKVQDFVDLFGLKGRGDPKHPSYKVCKRLRDNGCVVKDDGLPQDAAHRPFKRARVCDLQKYYPNLK